MRDALLLGRIIDANGHRGDVNPMPRGKDQQLELGLVARGNEAQPVQMMEGIKAIAALRVGQIAPRLERKPEVGKPRGEDGAA